MKTIYMFLTMAVALSAAGTTQTFTGVITDTMCGAKHGMTKGQPDDECIKMCTKGSSEYALFDGKTVLKLSDQKLAAKYPAKLVTVTGTLDEKSRTIKVASLQPAGDPK